MESCLRLVNVAFFDRGRLETSEPNITKISLPNDFHPDLKDRHFRPTSLKDDQFHVIGEGCSALVIAAIRRDGDFDQEVAIKRFDIRESSSIRNQHTILLREFQNLMFLVHPNIVKFVDSFYIEGAPGEINHIGIVSERMDTDLQFYFNILSKSNPDGSKKTRDHRHLASLLVQMFRALDFLHLRGIMHRDIAPKSLGMNRRNFEIKLLGFGSAGPINSKREHTKYVMTPQIYQPLEVILEKSYDCGVDVWAAGLVALCMLGCKLMMPSKANLKCFHSVKERILDVMGLPDDRYKEIFGDSLSAEQPRQSTLEAELVAPFDRLEEDREPILTKANLKDLILRILDVNPRRRPTAAECLEHPYLQLMNQRVSPIPSYEDDLDKKDARDKKLLEEMLQKFSRKF